MWYTTLLTDRPKILAAMKYLIAALAVFIVAGCVRESPPEPAFESANTTMPPRDIVFLTRDGCANTPVMRANLDAALVALGTATDYTVLDQGSLSTNDPRNGYPTPTILVNDRDLFGMPEPSPPFPAPS